MVDVSEKKVTMRSARAQAIVRVGDKIINQISNNELITKNYQGDFQHTPILVTTGDPDPHVPLQRVKESVEILEGLKAEVSLRVYKGRPHTIQMEEIQLANELILSQ